MREASPPLSCVGSIKMCFWDDQSWARGGRISCSHRFCALLELNSEKKNKNKITNNLPGHASYFVLWAAYL